MNALVSTFHEKFADWIECLLEHLQISLTALIAAIIIAVPLAILVGKNKRISELLLQITGVFQTIPSLALLGLFIPFMGIGKVPAVTALIIYALFPIMQNTVTGFEQIDRNLEEAAEAFGMTGREKLGKFELELAMPVIVSGVRTSAVMIIGTATLAALIGGGGLGSFILLGIDRNNSSLILIGAISAAIVAVLFNYVIKKLEKASLRKIALAFLVMIVALAGSFAPAALKDKPLKKLVIAGKLGPEPEILMNMYKILIEEKTDVDVTLKPNFGKTTFLYEALKAGEIDVYPEFTGTVTGTLLKNPPKLSNDPQTVYEAARSGIEKQDGLIMLKPLKYQNTYAVVVKRSFAQENGLEKISDLKKLKKTQNLKAGFTLEFNDRKDGYKGLRKIYGLDLHVRTMEPALRYRALEKGEVQLIDGYSTDSEIKQYDLVALKDDKAFFPPYQGAPLLGKKTLEEMPELKGILNLLAGKVTENEMIKMNYEVKVKGRSAYDVAKEYLDENKTK